MVQEEVIHVSCLGTCVGGGGRVVIEKVILKLRLEFARSENGERITHT